MPRAFAAVAPGRREPSLDRIMMFSARFLLLACLFFLLLAALVPTPTEGKITYIKPLWQPVSEWSPPEDREEHAELHSAAMKLYSEYVEKSGIQPCTYC